MKIGLQISKFTYPTGSAGIGQGFAGLVRAADTSGYASLWVMDHFFQISMIGPAEDPMLEAYTTLGFAAGISSNLKLGTLVTGVTYRHPGLLAKTVTTLDVLSGGRAYLGIGAAWFEREHLALGVPYPPTSERFERLEETLQIVQQMWSGEVKPYDGKHFHLAETLNQPAAVSTPHPPILIGGGGEQKTLRLVAKYADACNLFPGLELPHKLDVLKQRCEEVGRDYAEIEKTVIMQVPSEFADAGEQGHDALVQTLRDLADLGIDQAILSIQSVADPETVTMIGHTIIPRAEELAVAGR